MPEMLDNLLAMLERGNDSPMLRFTLGDLYMKREDPAAALEHLAAALRQDENYSAAWKLYGQALAGLEREAEAMQAFEQGIAAAEAQGNKQAALEMRVFLKRLNRN